jgi:TctA family transporter
MLLGLGGDLERLQLTIGFIAAQFRALAGIIAIYIFADVLSKAVLSVFPHNYFIGTVKSIVTPYRIVMIPLKDFLLQWCTL